MIAPRWRKVLRDIAGRPGRSLLAVVAMAAGVFQIAALVHKYAILDPLLKTMYSGTSPASAVLFTDDVTDPLVDSVRSVPGVGVAEARPVIIARVRVGDDEWMPIVLHVIREFAALRTDTFKPDAGAWPPRRDEILIERSAMKMTGFAIGDTVVVRNAAGDEQALRIAGTAHAPGMAPAWMDHIVPAFVPWESPARAALGGESAQIRIIVPGDALAEGHIREVADSAGARVEALGHSVSRVQLDPTGQHPHASQMNTFMYLLGAFGILSFILSAILVAGMVHGLLAEQIRQVGVMKAIGASSLQITGLYLGQIGLLSLVALAIGLPLGLLVGSAYAKFSAGILNVDVTDTPFPAAALAAVILVGVLVPLLISLVPILRASRITVLEALNDSPGPHPFGTRKTERWLSRITWLPRPVMLSVRTTFMRRGRLALTLGTLAMGGAVFMSALNVSGAWNRAVNEDFRMRRYDLTVVLAEAMSTARLDTVLATVPGVARAEYWPGAGAYLINERGVPGGRVGLLGPTRGSTLLELPLTAGHWLTPDDTSGVVINQGVVAGNPSLRLGGMLRLREGGRDFAHPIVGIAKELSPHPLVYAPAAAVLAISGKSAGMERAIRVVTDRHDDARQRAVAAAIEREFDRREIPVSGITRMLDQRKAILDHLVIVMAVLTMAASVVVFVGAVGLTSTLMLGVIQRTREIGIMSAIGARPGTIARHIWLEGVLMGVLSWGIAMVLALPVSVLLQSVTGRIFFQAPLDPFVSLGAGAIWLAIVVVLGSLSSLYPAWRASHLTVREALAHA